MAKNTNKNRAQTICFIHYGIGWNDGVNMVIRSFAERIQQEIPALKICFIGGVIKKPFLKKAVYKTLPELLPLPKEIKLTRARLEKTGLIIAKKLAKLTEKALVVVIENPFMGSYNLAAMLGYSIYAKKYKPKGTKLFFRIHDFYMDRPMYSNGSRKFFSASEMMEITKGEGVDGFFAINKKLIRKLAEEKIPKRKIFYLPNGVNEKLFNKPLKKEEREFIYNYFHLPLSAKIILYPVRVIPRKNIEEAFSLVKLLREGTKKNYVLVISGKVDKNDPGSNDYYEKLKKLKDQMDFPIIFAQKIIPLKRQYFSNGKIKKFGIGDLYQASEAIIMTSLKEGFGYPFLECWFSKKIIVGRRIDEVIKDFEKNGISFWWLYRKFPSKKIKGQIKLLKNKKERNKIIKNNFKAARAAYGISKAAERFIKLTKLK